MEKFIESLKVVNEHLGQKSNQEKFDFYNENLFMIETYDVSDWDVIKLAELCYELIDRDNVLGTIFIYSLIINLTKDKECSKAYSKEFVDYIIEADIPFQIKADIMSQLRAIFFNNPTADCGICLKNELLKSIINDICSQLDPSLLKPIPYEERDHDFVLVLTTQLLSLNHGPTKHTLDHCYALMNGMGKKVFLINTAEISGGSEIMVPFHNRYFFNYNSSYSEIDRMQFNGVNIPFFQCDDNMPNIPVIEMLINTVWKLKPEFILEIGSGSVLAGILDKIVPVLTNGTMHAQIESSATRYQTLARELNKEDYELLKECDIKAESIIYSMFTSTVKPKSLNISRSDLKLPKEAFVVASVGNRLGDEITDEIIEIMCNTIKRNPNIYYIFFGQFDSFEKRASSFSEDIREHFINHGFSEDIISCLENCDLYFNPPRIGGGMSSIEAFAVGIPAVTLLSGDGGIVIGEEFAVDTINDFCDEIVRYSADGDYYRNQAETAYNRGQYLQDSNRIFCDSVKDFIDVISNLKE